MQASNHSNKELFYFPASVRLDISDKAHYLLDEVRQHCFFEIIPQILAVCVVLLLLLHHTALVLVCFAGMESRNVGFFCTRIGNKCYPKNFSGQCLFQYLIF